jgi:HEAT repeat protein
MGFLNRLFGPKEAEKFEPLSEIDKQAIFLLGTMGNFNALAKHLKSRNPYVRAFTVRAVDFAGRCLGEKFELGAPMDERAIQLLIPLLRDSDVEVRKAAASSLDTETKNPEVARALEEYQANT